MPELTPLDQAHSEMEKSEHDNSVRLNFYERLAECELFMMLSSEASGDTLAPQVFPADGAQYVLVFDREERLAEFAGKIVPFAALSGRAIAEMLTGQGIGLGVNLDVAPSAILIPPDAVTWLAETVAVVPKEVLDKPVEVSVPGNIPEDVLNALDGKLALIGGMAKAAYLVTAEYETGRKGHLLGIVETVPSSHFAISQAISEALVFSGVEVGEIDVSFFRQHEPICAKMAKVGLRFDLPQNEQMTFKPKAPGMDPEEPPRLV